jgi:hypothetical protein
LLNYELISLTDFLQHFDYVLKNRNDFEEVFNEFINDKMYFDLLWFPCQNLKKSNDIRHWLSIIAILENENKYNFFDKEYAQSAISILCRNIVNFKDETKTLDDFWQEKIDLLNHLNNFFKERNLEVFEAVVLNEIVSYYYQIVQNITFAEEIVHINSDQFTSIEAKYLLCENIGKLFYNNKNLTKSEDYLLNALEFNCSNQIDFIDTLIYGASAISEKDSNKATVFCENAVSLVEARNDYSELDYIQILGELGISYWIKGDFQKSFDSFENVVEKLLKIKDTKFDKNWIRIFSWTGHALGYISSSVAKDKVPETISDGSIYIKPYQGLFTFNTKDLSDLYLKKKDPIILAHLAIFSEGINNISKSYYWSLRAFDLARKNGDQQIFMMISGVCSQYSLINFRIEEAFESYLLFSAVSSHLKGSYPEKHVQLLDINISELLSNKASEEWKIAEDTTVSFAIIPLFIMVLTAQVENSNDKIDRSEKFIYLIKDYIENASDKDIWVTIQGLITRILHKEVTERELREMANEYGEKEKKNYQLLCILGMIYITKDYNEQFNQILNIFPYLIKIYRTTRSIIKFVLLPFVKNRCLYILNNTYVGSKSELIQITDSINLIDISDKNAIQYMLQILAKEFEFPIRDDRKSWFYDFEEI